MPHDATSASAPQLWSARQLAALDSGLRELAAAPGAWSFAVEEAAPIAAIEPEREHVAASTIKLPLLVLALRRVDAGDWSQTAPLPGEEMPLLRQLELMIEVSDNDAANALIDAIGLERVGDEIDALGLHSTVLQRRLADPAFSGSGLRNATTAADMLRCLRLVTDGSTLRTASARHALGLLGSQQVDDRLPALLDASVRCRHKTGELLGIRHDVGMLEFDGRRVLIAAMGSQIPTASGTVLACAEATRVIGGAAALIVRVARDGA